MVLLEILHILIRKIKTHSLIIIPVKFLLMSYRIMASTQDFGSWGRGSIPCGTTI